MTPRRTFLWTGIDQALSAIANLLGTVLVARTGSPDGLGVFGLAFAAYLAGLGLVRASVGDPLVVSGAAHSNLKAVWGPAWVAVVPSLLGAAILTTVGLDVAAVVIAVLPALFIQYALRYAAFARRQPHVAALADGVWVTSCVALGIATESFRSPTLAAAAWATSGIASAAVAVVVNRAWPATPRASLASIGRIGRGLVWPLIGESLAVSAALTLLVPAVLALVSLPYAGLFRAASALAGPLAVVMTAWEFYSFPVITSAPPGRVRMVALHAGRLGILTGATTLGVTVAVSEPLQALLFDDAVSVPLWMVAAVGSALVLAVPGGVAQAVLKRYRRGRTLLDARLLALAMGVLLGILSLLISSVALPFTIPALTILTFGILTWRKAREELEGESRHDRTHD